MAIIATAQIPQHALSNQHNDREQGLFSYQQS